MRITNIIIENVDDDDPSNFVSAEFEQWLKTKGYQVIGRGAKIFYKSPKSGKVLVVIQPGSSKHVLDWINFCNQNANDPHLPKYTKVKTLSFQNPKTGQVEQYATAFTEELYENRRGLVIEVVETWGFYVLDYPNIVFSKAFEAFIRMKTEDGGDREEVGNAVLTQLGGYHEAANLFNSIKKTVLAGKKLGYGNDLLDDNIMFNRRGQLVLNDPWAPWG
jgi:predicted RNA binding protein YcfA (HicA-like mRNA interferase family)